MYIYIYTYVYFIHIYYIYICIFKYIYIHRYIEHYNVSCIRLCMFIYMPNTYVIRPNTNPPCHAHPNARSKRRKAKETIQKAGDVTGTRKRGHRTCHATPYTAQFRV